MCTNFRKTKRKKVTGYKVVAINENNGKYYSIMTGNKYPVDEDMPVWMSQRKKITTFFRKNTINRNKKKRQIGWSDELVGKTSVFKDTEPAFNLKRVLEIYKLGKVAHKDQYKLVVVKAKLFKYLKLAQYGLDTVYVGKRMKILEEVKQ